MLFDKIVFKPPTGLWRILPSIMFVMVPSPSLFLCFVPSFFRIWKRRRLLSWFFLWKETLQERTFFDTALHVFTTSMIFTEGHRQSRQNHKTANGHWDRSGSLEVSERVAGRENRPTHGDNETHGGEWHPAVDVASFSLCNLSSYVRKLSPGTPFVALRCTRSTSRFPSRCWASAH